MEGEIIDEKKRWITRKERKYFLLLLLMELQRAGKGK